MALLDQFWSYPSKVGEVLRFFIDMGNTGYTKSDFGVHQLHMYAGNQIDISASADIQLNELGNDYYEVIVSGALVAQAGVNFIDLEGAVATDQHLQYRIGMDVQQISDNLDDGTLAVQDVDNVTLTDLATAVTDVTNAVAVDAIANDTITAAAIATDAIDADAVKSDVHQATWNYSTRTLTSLGASAIQAVWDSLTSSAVTVGSFGVLIKTNLNAIISALETKIDTIQAQTDKLEWDAVATSSVKSAPQVALSVASADITSIADAVVDHATTTGGGDVKTCLRDAQGNALGKRVMKNVDLVAGTGQMDIYAADNITLLGTFDITFDVNEKPTERST